MQQYEKTEGKKRFRLVQEEVKAEVEEWRTSRAVGLRQQGAWTRWEHAIDRKVTWTYLVRAEPQRLKFLVQAVYDILPSQNGVSQLPTVPKQGHIGAHPEMLSSSSWAGAVHLVPQPGSETHCGSHQHGNPQQQTVLLNHPGDRL